MNFETLMSKTMEYYLSFQTFDVFSTNRKLYKWSVKHTDFVIKNILR